MAAADRPGPDSPGSPEPLEDVLDAEHLLAELEEDRPPHSGPMSQILAALAALAVGVFGAVMASRLGLGRLTQPGPGLWPFAVSVVIIALSAVLVVVGRTARDAEKFSRSSLQTAIALVTLILLAAMVNTTGFEIPSVLLVFVWLRWLGKESWRTSIVISLATVAAFYAIFVVLLQIPLPRLI
jgi:hypothetical protein